MDTKARQRDTEQPVASVSQRHGSLLPPEAKSSGQAGCLVPDTSRQPVLPDRTKHTAASLKLTGPWSHRPRHNYF